VIEWRRHLHANPELSNREVKTADFIAKRLKAMGLEVKTGIAHTGAARAPELNGVSMAT